MWQASAGCLDMTSFDQQGRQRAAIDSAASKADLHCSESRRQAWPDTCLHVFLRHVSPPFHTRPFGDDVHSSHELPKATRDNNT